MCGVVFSTTFCWGCVVFFTTFFGGWVGMRDWAGFDELADIVEVRGWFGWADFVVIADFAEGKSLTNFLISERNWSCSRTLRTAEGSKLVEVVIGECLVGV